MGSIILPPSVDLAVLREAAHRRAAFPAVHTPDAIHAATAHLHGCTLFITNDTDYRRLHDLSLVILDDVLSS